ncbi:MAG: pyruvate kinase [Chloroflexi bacterium]|nr:MAG: pyruvate kinase [Chloroflexota bacterium]
MVAATTIDAPIGRTAGHDTTHRRYVKIIATLGPAVAGRESLSALIEAGIDVARINCSHGTIEERARLIHLLRELADERGRLIPILLDLRGLKIRTGPLAHNEAVPLARGAKVRVYPRLVPTTVDQIGVSYPALLDVVRPGSRMLLADGLIELLVEDLTDEYAICSIGRGGPLASGQGVTLPNVTLQEASLTATDRDDLAFAARHGVELLGLSFLSSAEDIHTARAAAADLGARPALVAKIERPAALAKIGEIARAADAVMVARGDLGVQLPPEQIPRAQKEIIALCNRVGTPVITATQMLESMIMQPVPTRAETSDVANAVLDGTDAVMLSAETATGRHATASVEMMDRIIREVERDGPVRPPAVRESLDAADPERQITDALGRAARALSDVAPIETIIVFTLTGASARLVAKGRPRVPIIAVTTDPYVARQLSLVWGIHAIIAPLVDDLEQLLREASRKVVAEGLAREGTEALFVGSLPIYRVSGRTNLLHIRRLEG